MLLAHTTHTHAHTGSEFALALILLSALEQRERASEREKCSLATLGLAHATRFCLLAAAAACFYAEHARSSIKPTGASV